MEFRLIVKEYDSTLATSRLKAHKRSKQANVRKTESLFSTKAFVVEALKILAQIVELSKTLTYIRRPYLEIEAANLHLSHSSRSLHLNGFSEKWSSIKCLDEKERNEMDGQLGDLVSLLSSRIKDLEILEKKRIDYVATNINPVLRLLPARLVSHPGTMVSDFVAAHHMGILWNLSHRLSQTSQRLKDMQEERLKRQKENVKTLGAGASQEALAWRNQPINAEKVSESTRWSDIASNIASTITSSYLPSKPAYEVRQFEPEESGYGEGEQDIELTPTQISLFEQENSEMLQSMQDTLASVQQAEARLLDISALQMSLIAHLTHQTQITEQLYNDAVATSSTVDKGNIQLREAKERAKDSRLFLLVFLFGASFSLLFVHFYQS